MAKLVQFPESRWLAMTEDAIHETACLQKAVRKVAEMRAFAERTGNLKKVSQAVQIEQALLLNAEAWKRLSDPCELQPFRANHHNQHVLSLVSGYIIHLVHYRIESERLLITGFGYAVHAEAPPNFRLYPLLQDFNLVALCPQYPENDAA